MYNPHDKKRDYVKQMKALDLAAVTGNLPVEELALQQVKENIPQLRQYVIERGEQPENNPIALAAQVTLLHEQAIWDKVENEGIPDYEAAENQVLAEEQQKEDSGEISQFGGYFLGSICKAGQKALAKINEKRVAKGKKQLLAGKKGKALQAKIEKHIEVEKVIERQQPQKAQKENQLKNTVAGAFVTGFIDDVEKEKTKAAINKYLPFIIIGAVALFLIGRKTA